MSIPQRVLHVGLRGAFPAAGTPGRPPVVLLPAFPLTSRMWVPLERELAARGITAHGFDYPGFGTTPLWTDTEPSIDAIADAAVATLRGGIGAAAAHWVGCSMGGYVALAIAQRHPDAVAGLGLLDTKSSADDDAKRAARLDTARSIEGERTFPHPRAAAEGLVGMEGEGREAVVKEAEAIIAETVPAAAAWGQRAMAGRQDRTGVLEGFRGPSVVAWGSLDSVTSRDDADRMARALGSHTVVIDGAGHLSPLEAPRAAAAAVASLFERP
ncbi:MAG TPA: alpha/beta hydrolase [Demequinaceae bacterium]